MYESEFVQPQPKMNEWLAGEPGQTSRADEILDCMGLQVMYKGTLLPIKLE